MIDFKSLIGDIWKEGGEAYLVGGWVRDLVLKRKSEDIDIEVIGISQKKLEGILEKYGKYYKCGKSHEIYILSHSIEISYVEKKDDLKKLASRRDFTINALYYNPLTEEILDFFGGVEDIEARLISATNEEVFNEDPLRIIRGAELASRLNFDITDATMEQMKKSVNKLDVIPSERVVEEFKKIYLLGEKPSKAFTELNNAGVFEYILPRLVNLQRVIQDEVYHPEGDVFTHILMMLDVLPRKERSMDVFWGIIYHDMGKEETYPTFKDHCQVSKDIFIGEGRKMIKDKKLIKKIEALIYYHEEPLKFLIEGYDRIRLKKLAVKVDIPQLLKLYLCDVLGRGREDNSEELKIIEKIRKSYNDITGDLEPLISGRDLIEWKVENRKNYSKILSFLYKSQLEEKFIDKDGAKVFYYREIKGK